MAINEADGGGPEISSRVNLAGPIAFAGMTGFSLLLTILLFRPALTYLVGMWGREDFSYGYFILPIVFCLVWEKREALLTTPSTPSWSGFIPFGAASGAILIGEYPKCEVFEKNFNWPDSLIHLPFNSGEVYELINKLEMQPDRIENISRTNVAESLMRHDWYRWEVVLKIAGLDPTGSLLERKTRLKYISTFVKEK